MHSPTAATYNSMLVFDRTWSIPIVEMVSTDKASPIYGKDKSPDYVLFSSV